MIRRILSFYTPGMPKAYVFMFQQVDYEAQKYIEWLARIPSLNQINKRQELILTARARLILLFAYVALTVLLCASFLLWSYSPFFTLVLVVVCPLLLAGILSLSVYSAWLFIEKPRRERLQKNAKEIFASHAGTKIAIAGSYGKTSMKELLYAVLSTEKNADATKGNENVLISHAKWASTLSGNEEVLLVEYGEGEPGDIKKFNDLINPNMGVITGIAPNHLEKYKTLSKLANDFASIGAQIEPENLYIEETAREHIRMQACYYDIENTAGWEATNITVDYKGTSFTMSHGKKTLKIETQLLGRHHIPPIMLAVVIAMRLGVTEKSIVKAISKVKAHEHRMQLKQMHGAWVIDDTYNGNLEGIKAGLNLMVSLSAKRKIYVTPGLVDQGNQKASVHNEIGKHIATANPDKVVLMQNSTTEFIKNGLSGAGFSGEVVTNDDPLSYYSNLEHTLAAGDLVVMQNDWTDNYA